MDKRRIAQGFSRARSTYERAARVQQEVAQEMLCLLHVYGDTRRGIADEVLEVGCGTGLYSRLLLRDFHPGTLYLNDLCTDMQENLGDLLALPGVHFLPGDAEALPLPPRVSLITSCSTLQWFADPARFFRRCSRALMPGGLLCLSTFGPENLREIRAVAGGGLDYLTQEELVGLLPSGLHPLHVSGRIATLAFPTPEDVLRHLRQTGVTGTEKRVWTRGHLQAFTDEYVRLFSRPDGQVTLTYHPMFLVAERIAP